MNYLITAAGKGSRFLQAGIKPAKPLIRVKGKELLLWSLNSFNFSIKDKIFIVTLKAHNVRKVLSDLLDASYPGVSIEWLELDDVTDGQLRTALVAVNFFEISGPLTIHNCDSYFTCPDRVISKILENDEIFGIIPCFEAEGDHWSFVKTREDDPCFAEQVSEKVRISNHCSIGTYIFKDSDQFKLLASKFSLKQSKINGELYIAPLYDYALKNGKSVKIVNAPSYKIYGTPKELLASFSITHYQLLAENAWDAHQKSTLVVDIDGTLCGPPIHGDYSAVKPINSVCDSLREAHKSGSYIILFTARNMRSFNGSIGLINKFTAPILLKWLDQYNIPYDEIHFGKPWGNNVKYIDDKTLEIDEFVNN